MATTIGHQVRIAKAFADRLRTSVTALVACQEGILPQIVSAVNDRRTAETSIRALLPAVQVQCELVESMKIGADTTKVYDQKYSLRAVIFSAWDATSATAWADSLATPIEVADMIHRYPFLTDTASTPIIEGGVGEEDVYVNWVDLDAGPTIQQVVRDLSMAIWLVTATVYLDSIQPVTPA